MDMKLACADFTFPLLGHGEVLDLIGAMAFEGVDIGLFEGRSHLWPSCEFTDLAGSARRLRQRLDDLGLEAADVFLQMNPDLEPYAINHPEGARRDKARDWFTRTLEYAAALGAAHVTTIPGVPFESESGETSYGRSVEELRWRVDEAKRHGIVFGTEAHVGSIAPSPSAALGLLGDVPGLTLTLDYTHFTRHGVPDDEIEPLVGHATHFHVRGAKEGRLQASFGDNVIDYRRVVENMRETGYRGWLGIEYVWIDWEHCNECDNLSETILYRNFLREMEGKA